MRFRLEIQGLRTADQIAADLRKLADELSNRYDGTIPPAVDQTPISDRGSWSISHDDT
ncbi:hypothetical protein [Agromyces larvae]|uniref:Uncharacterized protein n=1 Tax=Agromyces larvae TaxID=2929802 RepID=A0ABY4C3L4_9MICO|nr:hypothetical protein [Agromyces larvae]UOE45948.1 hypothetical protein MTO99_09465 [Agromyces larvae]